MSPFIAFMSALKLPTALVATGMSAKVKIMGLRYRQHYRPLDLGNVEHLNAINMSYTPHLDITLC